MTRDYRGLKIGFRMSRMFAVGIVFSLLCLSPALAMTASDDLDSIHYTVYAPDWIWQQNAVNILVVLKNDGDADVEAGLALVLPAEFADHFDYTRGDEENRTVTVPAGETVRHAFTNIVARSGVPLQTYDFQLLIDDGAQSRIVNYPLRTIRGPVVNSARWAALLPAIIGAACCLLFVFFLRSHAAPGAWRTPGDPVKPPEHPEPWISRKP
jgi:hypothetical protein